MIEWRNVRYFDDATRRVDFEVVLYENGQILTQYRNIADDAREQGSSATLGLENADGTVAFQYSFNEAVMGSPTFAIRYLLPPSGFVQGTVTDANDHQALAGVDGEGAAGREHGALGNDRRRGLLQDAGSGRELHDRSDARRTTRPARPR